MRIPLLPTTPTGTWAARGLITFVVIYIVSTITVATSQIVNNTEITISPAAEQVLRILAPLGVLIGAITGVASLVAVIKYRERSAPVWLGVALALLITTFIVGEIVLPH